MASDKDKVLGHGVEADGIEEYDNQLPLWWLGLFAFTVAFERTYAPSFRRAMTEMGRPACEACGHLLAAASPRCAECGAAGPGALECAP